MLDKTKILISTPNFFPHSFGGGEMYVYRLAKELIRRGYTMKILTPSLWNGGNGSYQLSDYSYEDISVTSLALNSSSVNYVEANTGFGPITLDAVREVIKRLSPDFVHINGLKPVLVQLCNEMKIPHVVTAHHTGIVCPAGSLLRTDGSDCDKEISPENCVPCCNFSRRPKWYSGGLIGVIPSWIYRPLGERLSKSRHLNYFERGLITPWLVEKAMAEKKATLQNAQLFIAPSNFMRNLLVTNGCSPEKVIVIPHGVEAIEKTTLPVASSKTIRFGYIGRIDPYKGLHLLLEAARRLTRSSSCEIHIFGAARHPWHEAYLKKALSSYKGEANVINHGLVPHNELRKVFSQIDVLTVPSILPEAFGLVVAEAFSAGRPVIVFDSGALPELVTNGEDGFVVTQNDSKSLAEAMQRFVDNPDLILKMSIQIPHVRTIQEHVDELEKLYEMLVSSRVPTTINKVYK